MFTSNLDLRVISLGSSGHQQNISREGQLWAKNIFMADYLETGAITAAKSKRVCERSINRAPPKAEAICASVGNIV